MQATYESRKFEFEGKVTVSELLKEEIENSEHQIVGCEINNEYSNLENEVQDNCTIKLLDTATKEGAKIEF